MSPKSKTQPKKYKSFVRSGIPDSSKREFILQYFELNSLKLQHKYEVI
jgi:hypothetical protein